MLSTELKMSLVFKNKITYVLSMSRFSSRNKLERSASMIFFCQTVGTSLGEYFVIFLLAPWWCQLAMRDDQGEPGAGIASYSRITLAHIGHRGLRRKGQYSLKYKSGANTADRDHGDMKQRERSERS